MFLVAAFFNLHREIYLICLLPIRT